MVTTGRTQKFLFVLKTAVKVKLSRVRHAGPPWCLLMAPDSQNFSKNVRNVLAVTSSKQSSRGSHGLISTVLSSNMLRGTTAGPFAFCCQQKYRRVVLEVYSPAYRITSKRNTRYCGLQQKCRCRQKIENEPSELMLKIVNFNEEEMDSAAKTTKQDRHGERLVAYDSIGMFLK